MTVLSQKLSHLHKLSIRAVFRINARINWKTTNKVVKDTVDTQGGQLFTAGIFLCLQYLLGLPKLPKLVDITSKQKVLIFSDRMSFPYSHNNVIIVAP